MVSKRTALLILIAFAILLSWQTGQAKDNFALQVARRCKGEASFAITACACTVKNRLAVGWRADRVLTHYYAPDSAANATDVTQVENVLNGKTTCSPDYYYMFSASDKRKLGLGTKHLAGTVSTGKKTIWLYDRQALRDN